MGDSPAGYAYRHTRRCSNQLQTGHDELEKMRPAHDRTGALILWLILALFIAIVVLYVLMVKCPVNSGRNGALSPMGQGPAARQSVQLRLATRPAPFLLW